MSGTVASFVGNPAVRNVTKTLDVSESHGRTSNSTPWKASKQSSTYASSCLSALSQQTSVLAYLSFLVREYFLELLRHDVCRARWGWSEEWKERSDRVRVIILDSNTELVP
jgi:hypothetical protein